MSVYYVDIENGSDSNKGLSFDHAFKSMEYAQQIAVSGDIVIIV